MQLFSAKKRELPNSENQNQTTTNSILDDSNLTLPNQLKQYRTFEDLGLSLWCCQAALNMGFKKPTEIQKRCIPSILEGSDVLASAETGSGKTAAFALPILNQLSFDPYGIYAIIITPTRELAVQIREQISALGALINVRCALIIGGENVIQQGLALSKRPHIVIATPGRFRHHLQSADPPNIKKIKYLVLDEADRLLSSGFESELQLLITQSNPKRQTLLFSATLTTSIIELQQLSNVNHSIRIDLTVNQKIPSGLIQNYYFVPSKMKISYLVTVLKKTLHYPPDVQVEVDRKKKKMKRVEKLKEDTSSSSSTKSVIVFVGTCKKCQEITEILSHVDVQCVGLHSLMNQSQRMLSLSKFKNEMSRVLISTDVASRGLDIPTVDLVINLDLPKISSDYVHRIGRTARAGRGGQALSLVSQYDMELMKDIEKYIGQDLILWKSVSEEEVVKQLNPIAKAMREAQIKLLDNGFQEKVVMIRERKRKQQTRMKEDQDE